jgi:hypothetical protein
MLDRPDCSSSIPARRASGDMSFDREQMHSDRMTVWRIIHDGLSESEGEGEPKHGTCLQVDGETQYAS